MSPSLMDTGDEHNSAGSLSAEESNSNTAGSEREGEGQRVKKTGTKRREKNRDAARRTRRKQTERADELHEELQQLEQSNSALQKEIAALEKDLHGYTKILAHHKPYCRLRVSASTSSSTKHLSVSPSADCHISSSPPKVTPQASSSILACLPLVSKSLTSSLDLKTLECVENMHVASSSSASTATTLSSSSGLSTELNIASSSSSFSSLPGPQSLFSKEPSITTRVTNVKNVTPVCTSQLSTSVTSSAFTTTGQAVALPYPQLAGGNGGLVAQRCPVNVPSLHSSHNSGNPDGSSPLCAPLSQNLQDPALQPLTVSPQANFEQSPAPAFDLKPGYGQHMTSSPASLLSLLTVPSPLNIPHTTSSTDGLIWQPASSLLLPGDSSSDLSLSELLEVNDWILSGTSNQ